MHRLLMASAVFFAAVPAWAQMRPHLCNAGEVPAFSCSTGTKTVSLCVSPDLDDRKGTLIYRFGTRQKIELTYPDAGMRPQDSFRSGVGGYSGGGAEYLRFKKTDTTYTLYSDYYRGREEDGLVVERGGKRISVLKCRASAIDPGEGWSRIYKAKLPKNEEDFDVPGVTGQ